jgi:hypothetical protein
MRAAIRDTRGRLAEQFARTADHVHLLFETPPAGDTEAPAGGVVAGAIRTIAFAGRVKRVWSGAGRTGFLRLAAISGVTVAIAAALATRTRRR